MRLYSWMSPPRTSRRRTREPATTSQEGVGFRRSKVDAPVGPGPVVVLGVRVQYTMQMTPAEDQHVVEALASNGANPTFRERVALGARTGVVTTLRPSVRKTSSKAPENLAEGCTYPCHACGAPKPGFRA